MRDAEQPKTQVPTSPKSRQGGRRSALVGWLFIAPAVVLLVWQQVVPAVRTVVGSFQDDGGAWVGLANYETAVEWGLTSDLVGGIGFGLLPAVLGFVAGFGAGRLFAAAQGTARRVGLVLLALALLWIAPSSLMLGSAIWIGVGQPALPIGLLTWLPAALVIGALVGAMLPARVRVQRVLTFGALIAAVAGGALGTQATALAPFGSVPSPPAGRLYTMAFSTINIGPALAIGTVLLAVAIVSGVVVTQTLLASGLRLRIAPRRTMPEQVTPEQTPPAPRSTGDAPAGSGAPAVIVGAVILLVAVLASLPWLLEALRGEPAVEVPWVRVWLGDGLQVLAAVVVAALAGTGIGYLRPLGDRSLRVLLSALSPLLLVGLAPLLPTYVFDRFADFGDLGALDSLHPQVVVVPLVFLAAYLADARHTARREQESAAPGRVMAAALGLAGVALLVLRSESSALRMLPDGAQQRDVAIGAVQRLDVAAMVAQLKPWPVMLLLAAVAALCAAGMRRLRIDVEARASRRR